MNISWMFGSSMSARHLLYVYLSVWFIQCGYCAWVAWHWMDSHPPSPIKKTALILRLALDWTVGALLLSDISISLLRTLMTGEDHLSAGIVGVIIELVISFFLIRDALRMADRLKREKASEA